MNLKSIRIYLVITGIFIAFFAYSCWTGFAFYNDAVIKNTEYNGNKGRSGHINRFYHK